MILSAFEFATPYRLHCFAIFIAAFVSLNVIVGDHGGVDLKPGIAVPDVALGGYTPQEALDWYAAIGETTRRKLVPALLIDILVIVPTYTLFMGSQLLTKRCRPAALCYLPAVVGFLDWIETLTTLYGVTIYPSSPSESHLRIASLAVQVKLALFMLSMILSIYFTVFPILSIYFTVFPGRAGQDNDATKSSKAE